MTKLSRNLEFLPTSSQNKATRAPWVPWTGPRFCLLSYFRFTLIHRPILKLPYNTAAIFIYSQSLQLPKIRECITLSNTTRNQENFYILNRLGPQLLGILAINHFINQEISSTNNGFNIRRLDYFKNPCFLIVIVQGYCLLWPNLEFNNQAIPWQTSVAFYFYFLPSSINLVISIPFPVAFLHSMQVY